MESLIVVVVLALAVFPLWVLIRIISLGRQNDALAIALRELQQEVAALRAGGRAPAAPPAMSTMPVPAKAGATPPVAPASASTLHPSTPPSPVAPASAGTSQPPPPTLPPPAIPPALRPVAPPPPPTPAPAPEPRFQLPQIDWEHFMGAKLFAWLGGLAAFLGAAFFVKYSFERDLIPPEVRVAIGYLFALGLVIGGLKVSQRRYAVTAQTLIATGIVCLYGVTFACNSIYHFAFFGPFASFAIMSLITATAFLLAVRLDARVVAILGICGGFLTPVLLSTGQDNPVGLFGYILLLDTGLIAVALQRRWSFLVPLGAAGTVLMQIGWAIHFLRPAKANTAVAVALLFCVGFLGAYLLARRFLRQRARPGGDGPSSTTEAGGVSRGRDLDLFAWSALALPAYALALAFALLFQPAVVARPGLLLTFVLGADASLLALGWFHRPWPRLHLAAGLAAFTLLAGWTATGLTATLLPWALAFTFAYAVLHTAYPLVLHRLRPESAPTVLDQLFPALALTVLLVPILTLEPVSLVVWPTVLVLDGLALLVAALTGSLLGVAAVLVLTLIATAAWILQLPQTLAPSAAWLLVIGGFAVFFFAGALWLGRRMGGTRLERLGSVFGDTRSQLPALAATMPFLLLVMIAQRLDLPNPSPLFGLALLLAALTLGLAAVLSLEWLPACALLGVALVESSWHARHANGTAAGLTLAWYLLFHAAFTVYPFLFRERFRSLTGPWAIGALAGVAQFPLVYRVVERAWPNDGMGLLPAIFAVPPLLALAARVRAGGVHPSARLNQLAWYGGIALLFITLIFPIQFDRQWLTLAWALEGAALLWLFHRVPHPGLRLVGVVLLVVAFARLALNPAVLHYHSRSEVAVFNWYLYSYGVVIAALFVGARLLAPPRETVLGANIPPLLNSLGTILTFLLLNIEIADYFSAPGARVLTFEFSGNFARDMTYTIAWALFALVLLLVSLWRGLRQGRYAALALLGAAVVKLFFHDLARLDALYRVGALLAVAAIAIAASFAYQRFLPGDDQKNPPS